MPTPSTPRTFDAHLGSLIADLARPKGGRKFIADLLDVSKKTIDRRVLGDGAYTVREVHIIGHALRIPAAELISLALRQYANGTVEEGVEKLIAEANVSLDVSDDPVSLSEHRAKKKKPSEMTENEMRGEDRAATDDPAHLEDEAGDP